MLSKDARAHAHQAGRGSLSSLETLLRGIIDGETYREYAGSPYGNLTPNGVGERVFDTTNNEWYTSLGLTNTDWRRVGGNSIADVMTFSDDFLAAAISDEFSSTAGSGTGNAAATTVAGAVNGEITLKSASDDGAHGANCSSLTLDQLNFKGNQGGVAMEARIKIDDVSEAVLFVGFTDTISSTVELPIFLVAADIDSDAADACGVGYDVDGTTKQFFHGGVKAGTDTTPAYSGGAPTDDTYFTVRVEVSAEGAVRGYINGVAIGAAVADAATITVAMTPAIVIGNRSANQVIASVDYFWCQQNR